MLNDKRTVIDEGYLEMIARSNKTFCDLFRSMLMDTYDSVTTDYIIETCCIGKYCDAFIIPLSRRMLKLNHLDAYLCMAIKNQEMYNEHPAVQSGKVINPKIRADILLQQTTGGKDEKDESIIG